MTGEAIVQISTEQEPYHYLGSGLTNVYLVGVEYSDADGQVQADIPGLPKLLEAIGDAVAGKKSQLSGEEIRFLRKRLRIASKDFAGVIGMTPEHYSRIENEQNLPQLKVQLLVRLLYAAMRHEAWLSKSIAEQRIHLLDEKRPSWNAAIADERIIACRDEAGAWKAQAELAA